MTQPSLFNMYIDDRRNRTLLRDGRSVVSPFQAARLIFEGKEIDSVLDSFDARNYELMYGGSVVSELGDVEVVEEDHNHTPEELDFVYEYVLGSPRLVETEEAINRIEREMEFFEKTLNVVFLVHLIKLVEEWRRDGVVWGVGRGSASASYVLYLIGVHDVDPLKYDIPFSEMSKIQENIDD